MAGTRYQPSRLVLPTAQRKSREWSFTSSTRTRRPRAIPGRVKKATSLNRPLSRSSRDAVDQHGLVDGLARAQGQVLVDRRQRGAAGARQFDVFENEGAGGGDSGQGIR